MCNNDAAFSYFNDALGNFIKFRSIVKHLAINTCKIYYKRLYFSFRVDQTYELVDNFVTIKPINSYFCDAFFVELSTGSFYVKYCVNV